MTTTQESDTNALKYYEQAMKLKPEDNYSKEAEELLKKAITLNDSLPDAHTALGYTLLQKGTLPEAVKSFAHAVELV